MQLLQKLKLLGSAHSLYECEKLPIHSHYMSVVKFVRRVSGGPERLINFLQSLT